MSMRIPRRTLAAWGVLAVTTLSIPALAWGMCTQTATTPGGEATCSHALPPQAWLVVGLLAVTGGALLWRPPALALVPAVGALAVIVVFGMSIGLLLLHGVVAVTTVSAWLWCQRRDPDGQAMPADSP